MALFESKRKKELQEQEKEAFENPSPKALANLISQYMASGNLDKALEVGKRAMDLFPESQVVISAYQNLKRLKLDTRMISLHREIQVKPDRSHYEALASIYFSDLNNKAKAFEIAQEALKKFPESDGLHLICGLIRMERYHKDFLANDFREAMGHFEKASEANPMNYRALLSLGRLYAEAGVFPEARHVFDKLLQFCPSDEYVDRILKIMTKNESGSREISALDDILSSLERRGKLDEGGEEIREVFDPPKEALVRKISAVQLETFVKEASDTSGFRCVAVIGLDGGLVTGRVTDESQKESFRHAVKTMADSCIDSSRRMDMGSFSHAEILTSKGTLIIVSARGYLMGYQTVKQAKQDEISNVVEKFVGSVTYF